LAEITCFTEDGDELTIPKVNRIIVVTNRGVADLKADGLIGLKHKLCALFDLTEDATARLDSLTADI
jgi:hypothetical protein